MRPRPLVTAGVLAAATVLVITGAAGCRRKASPPPAPAPAPIVAPTAMQLPDDAAPVRYLARFEVDPAAETFHGHVEITVTLARPLRALWLDAKDLTIHAATWRSGAADRPLRVLDDPAAPDRRGFTLEPADGPVTALPAGEATLVIDYDGRQTAEQSYGLRRKEDRGDWYIVTQHEATGARRAAPCFDEPRFKVPWQVELTVPAGMMALSNAPVDAEDDLPDGRHHVRFAATPPIPSYLLALAVGPFDAVDAGATRGGAPMRIIVPRGRGDDARYVAGEVGKLVAALEDYTGIPYPYAKLDSIVVPGAPRGAMENPGLITYAPRLLLIPDDESDATRRTSIEVMAHELAHQWFGDLVTMRWWDDIWLNEAFASWAEPWVVDQVHPELAGGMTTVDDRRVALDADGLATARTIRQPVDDEAALGKAFDRITYQKGATVIRMFEQWLGADVFRRGVQRYLTAFAWKNATAADFLAAIGDAADRDVATPFSTFLDASGAPLVELELSCPAGKPAVLAMHQRRWLRSGHAEAPPRAAWQPPVCVRVAGETEARCALLTGATGELPLGDACPAWVVPNAGGRGYYRASLSAPLRAGLLAAWDALTAEERHAFAVDVAGLVASGDLDLTALLDLLPRLGASVDPMLPELAATTLDGLDALVDDADRAAFTGLVDRVIGGRARRLGWTARAHEPFADADARETLVPVVATAGGDAALADGAVALTRAWLADHAAIPRSLWSTVLDAAVEARPDDVFDALLAALPGDPDVAARRAIVGALGHVRDHDRLGRALALLLDGDTTPTERLGVLGGAAGVDRRGDVFDFVRAHAAELQARLDPDAVGALVVTPCDPARRADAVAYLDGLAAVPRIGKLGVRQATEQMDQCIAAIAARGPALTAYLRR